MAICSHALSDILQRSVSDRFVSAPDCRLLTSSANRKWRKNAAISGSVAQESVAVIARNVQDFKLAVNRIPLQHADTKTSTQLMKIEKCIQRTKNIFQDVADGEITVSPYDTAWVALLPSLRSSSEPLFPSSLRWIMKSQLPDGSWGDSGVFSVRDRILNTLSCVVALKKWNVFPEGIARGLDFIRKYIPKMNDEDETYTLIGFEIVFPALMEDAKRMGLELPYDTRILQKIFEERALKLKRIPPKVLNEVPSTLLHSLEGLQDQVKWDKLSKLQAKNGSYLFSPASTACAFLKTGDIKSLEYLARIIKKFDGGAPNVYPVDLFERLWIVDRLERLGISRYFRTEIFECLEYVRRHWSHRGIGWARESPVKDLDDTSMAFRLLRLHGFRVEPEAFNHFKENDQFFCFFGQTNQSITAIFNLYRASQISFPGETILQEAMNFTKSFFERMRTNKLKDKWVISQDLVGEVEYALKYPWYSSQPRIEARTYIDQYGVDDVWIGKTMYRMPFVNNRIYLDLAKEDFNFCQSVHQSELLEVLSWYESAGLNALGLSEDDVVKSYFLSAVATFEPEMAAARFAWTKSSILMRAVRNLFSTLSAYQRKQFSEAFSRHNPCAIECCCPQSARTLLTCLLHSMNIFYAQGCSDNPADLKHTWDRWLEEESKQGKETLTTNREGEVIVVTAAWVSGRNVSQEREGGSALEMELQTTNAVCCLLRRIEAYNNNNNNTNKLQGPEDDKEREANDDDEEYDEKIQMKHLADRTMRELLGLLYHRGTWVSLAGRLCLSVAKSFYYAAYCSNQEMARHMKIVLFQPVR